MTKAETVFVFIEFAVKNLDHTTRSYVLASQFAPYSIINTTFDDGSLPVANMSTASRKRLNG